MLFRSLVFQMAHDHIDFSDAVLVEGGDDRVDHPDAVYLDQRLGCLKGDSRLWDRRKPVLDFRKGGVRA